MAFKYRKREPGSGGRRPGAGRRPDVSHALRRQIGNLYDRYYREERLRFFYSRWFEELHMLWIGLARSPLEKQKIYDQFRNDPNINISRLRFLQKLIYEPEALFDENGSLNFHIDLVRSISEAFAAVIGAPSFEFDRHAKLPRGQVYLIRKTVFERVRHSVSITPSLSDGFILSCWQQRALWIV